MEMDVAPAEQGAGASAVLAGAVLATLRPDPSKQMDRQVRVRAKVKACPYP